MYSGSEFQITGAAKSKRKRTPSIGWLYVGYHKQVLSLGTQWSDWHMPMHQFRQIRRLIILKNLNPLTTIGTYLSHENWSLNWPDFAACPALLGWPAHSRHIVACIHRFSHILRWPPKPAVWFMPEWRAVAMQHTRKYADLPIIPNSF